jgi:hypothetical protein
MGIQWDQADDEDTEPPVPAGLADLSGALRAVADFLDIDEDLLAVAAEASPPAATIPRQHPRPERTRPARPDGSPAVDGGRGTQDRPRGILGAGPPCRRRTRGNCQSRRLQRAPGPSRRQSQSRLAGGREPHRNQEAPRLRPCGRTAARPVRSGPPRWRPRHVHRPLPATAVQARAQTIAPRTLRQGQTSPAPVKSEMRPDAGLQRGARDRPGRVRQEGNRGRFLTSLNAGSGSRRHDQSQRTERVTSRNHEACQHLLPTLIAGTTLRRPRRLYLYRRCPQPLPAATQTALAIVV